MGGKSLDMPSLRVELRLVHLILTPLELGRGGGVGIIICKMDLV